MVQSLDLGLDLRIRIDIKGYAHNLALWGHDEWGLVSLVRLNDALAHEAI